MSVGRQLSLGEKKVIASFLLLIVTISIFAILYVFKEKEGVIGVIDINGYIIYDEDRTAYLKMIEYALRNDTIKGVIVRVRSPGGYLSMVEDIYKALKLLSDKKPTIAVIQDIAASGGYYIALGANTIIAEPGSFIGNVGVIVIVPYQVRPTEEILESGPYKLLGVSLLQLYDIVKIALDSFLQVIKERRGEKLKVSLKELSEGKLYLGITCKEYGLIDLLGSMNDAIEMLLKLTGLKKYKVVSLSSVIKEFNESWPGAILWELKKKVSIAELTSSNVAPLKVYYLSPLYINLTRTSQIFVTQRFEGLEPFSDSELNIEGTVLIDLSHRNDLWPSEIGTLLSELVKQGLRVRFISDSNEFMTSLRKAAKALIIVNPNSFYNVNEVKLIIDFTKKGGKLILIYDPSRTYAIYVNSIAMDFGIYFVDGFLYNLEDHYKIYRNVIVTEFNNSEPLAKNLTKLVLFTATHVVSNGTAIAFTSNTTVLSTSESSGVYNPIVLVKNVVAIGDLTFLSDPYCYLADNKIFVKRLVEFIKGCLDKT